MNENKVIESKLCNTMPFNIAVCAIAFLVDLVSFNAAYQQRIYECASWTWDWDWVVEKYGKHANVFTVTLHDMIPVIIVSIIAAAVIIVVFNLLYKKIQLVVTDKKVYGRVFCGKRVDLPIDSISAVGTSLFKSISIATSSGYIKFLAIANRDEIHEKISELLINRQQSNKVEQQIANNNVPTSNNDNIGQLKELKELLDQGIINQEEFDAKKKQLLGL